MAENYAEYLKQIYAGLRSGCGGANTDLIFAEAKAHLEDGISENIARGMTRGAAERAAMERFGNADAVCAWYAVVHRRPTMLMAARWPLFVILVYLILNPILSAVPALWGFRGLAFVDTFLVAMIVVCYRSRRFTLPILAPALAIVFFCFWLGFVCFSVPVPGAHGGYYPISKSSVASVLAESKAEVAKLDRRLAIMELGSQVFQSATPPNNIGIFKDPSGGYRIPEFFAMQDNPRNRVFLGNTESNGVETWTTAKQLWAPQKASRREVEEHLDVSPYVYVRGVIGERRAQQRVVDELPVLSTRPWQRNLQDFLPSAWFAIYVPAFVAVLGDSIGGILRMMAEAIRRRRASDFDSVASA